MLTKQEARLLLGHISAIEAELDQAQARLDENRQHLTEDEIWNTQTNIDLKRLDVALSKIQTQQLAK